MEAPAHRRWALAARKVLAEKTPDCLLVDLVELEPALAGPPRKVRNATDIPLDGGVRVLAELQIIDVRVDMGCDVASQEPVASRGMKANIESIAVSRSDQSPQDDCKTYV